MNPSIRTIEQNEVHIWKYAMTKWKKDCLSLLSEEEKNRWIRYHTIETKQKFALAHSFLRTILEGYTGIPAVEINIVNDSGKKPMLKESGQCPIYFNLSYRENYALVAIATSTFVGVDIEYVRMINHISSFVYSYFSYEERQKVLAYKNKYDRLAMLFSIWVMKEAFIKAKSKGLSDSLTQYNLCPFLETPECAPDFDSNNTWHIAQFRVADNYKAACAIRSEHTNFKIHEYTYD